MDFYSIPLIELEKKYNTNKNTGLSEQQAQDLLHTYGPNEIIDKKASLFFVFLKQFCNPLIYILLIAAGLIFFLGYPRDALIISGVLLFNSLIGTIQEGRSRSLIFRLKQLASDFCIVIRNGTKTLIKSNFLVPGDIILLHEGERVPADARIIEGQNIRVNESLFSGESSAVEKNAFTLSETLSLFEQKNMLFNGTYIISGTCKALIVATGMDTQVGKLQKQASTFQIDMPLKKQLETLTHKILILVLIICGALFLIGILQGKSFTELLVILTALFICVVPEGLPLVFTIVLVSGAYRLSKYKVLVKHLQAVEGLGCTDVIILDKTGTLTRNELMVTKAYAQGLFYDVSGLGYFPQGAVMRHGKQVTFDVDAFLFEIGKAAALLNTAHLQFLEKLKIFEVKGDPTEAALGVFAQKLGFEHAILEQGYEILYTLPFTSEFPFHGIILKHADKIHVYGAGSPEIVARYCTHKPDTEALNQLLAEGLRVIAFAEYNAQNTTITDAQQFFRENLLGKMTFLGYCAIQDSIRPEVQEALLQARQSGLHIVMATGDHKTTALSIAQQTGIFQPGDTLLEGKELENLSDAALQKQLTHVSVFARVTPEHKLKIIQAYHNQGLIVAMTGDGMNDVPSLVAADIGIAMGASGTDIAKEAADLVLLNDSFSSIIEAIAQGRHIFYALRRVTLYFFATNLGEVFVILFALILNMPIPISAAQILWLNLVTDGFLDIALAAEKREDDILQKQWLKTMQKKGLIDTRMLLKIVYMALPMAIGSLWFFKQYYHIDMPKARTMTLICMAMFQWFNAWNCRSETRSLFQHGLFSNPWLVLATSGVFILQILVTQVPFLQNIFSTVPLSLHEWLLIFAISSSIVVIEEIRKAFVRQRQV